MARQPGHRQEAKNGKRPGPPPHDDLVQRDFTASRMNELWLTDITEHSTAEGKVYLCAIKDVPSGRWATRTELRLAIITWIERTYHRRRRQARLGRLAPVECQTIMTTQVALAA